MEKCIGRPAGGQWLLESGKGRDTSRGSHELDDPIWEGRASEASAQWDGKCRGGGQAHKRLEREGGSIDGIQKKKEIGKKKETEK